MDDLLTSDWLPAAWRGKPTVQIPVYDDAERLQAIESTLRSQSGLVTPHEIRGLLQGLQRVVDGEATIIQGGDCAEALDDEKSNYLDETLQALRQIALLTATGTSREVITIGRIAGQFAKPRSDSFEERDGTSLPSYRGDIINGADFAQSVRRHDPDRMLLAYRRSAETLAKMREAARVPDHGISTLHAEAMEHSQHLEGIEGVRRLRRRICGTVKLLAELGVGSEDGPISAWPRLYTSHEALLLPYEEQMTRQDSEDGKWYNCSAHTVWIGERTRQPDHGHVEYARGIANPIGLKCGPGMLPQELLRLLDILNPENKKGRISAIVRLGVQNVRSALPSLMKAARETGRHVCWMVDPMHGNTVKIGGVKTRRFDDVLQEAETFIAISGEERVHFGGLHLEMTGANVTECVGGTCGIEENDVSRRYLSKCDPRLNPTQAIELVLRLIPSMEGQY